MEISALPLATRFALTASRALLMISSNLLYEYPFASAFAAKFAGLRSYSLAPWRMVTTRLTILALFSLPRALMRSETMLLMLSSLKRKFLRSLSTTFLSVSLSSSVKPRVFTKKPFSSLRRFDLNRSRTVPTRLSRLSMAAEVLILEISETSLPSAFAALTSSRVS